MGDYDYEIQEDAAQRDLRDAAQLQTDAGALRTDAATDYTQADAVQRMGLNDEGQVLRATGAGLEARASDFDNRASHLEHSAGLERDAAGLLRERDTAAAGANAAEIHAQGAQVVLDFVDLNEQDRTRWTGEAGAATGEADALHKRADDLTNDAVATDQEANRERDAARAGLDGRPWPGVGRPPGDPTTPAAGE